MPGAIDKTADRAEAARVLEAFKHAGATPVETDLLQPAETLLDLYGEDIRGRAFITQDPDQGEMMLRPDFTVPVVQMHMDNIEAGGPEPARYAYMGEVFRKQESDATRAREYLQVGFELFDRTDPARADAEVFSLFSEVLSPLNLRAVTGDIGILIAVVNGLSTSERRRAALRRHIWRPRRFRTLLDRFTGRTSVPAHRAALIADPRAALAVASDAVQVGKRGPQEVADRIEALRIDAATPPIGEAEADGIDAVLDLKAPLSGALQILRDIAIDLPAISDATDMFEARLEALDAAGITIADIPFEATYGRTSMEYYDGFVFGFTGAPHLPPVATGGRYDALTSVLGQGRAIPAVGGVIRPALVRQMRENLT